MQGMYAAALAGPHPAWEILQQHIARNLPEYLTFVGALFVAGVCCMPATRPKGIDDWYTWFRDTLQTAVPAARAGRTEVHKQEATTPTNTTATTSVVTSAEAGATDPIKVPLKEG